MKGKIIVPADFTEQSNHTVEYAFLLSQKMKKNLELVHAENLAFYGSHYNMSKDIKSPPITNRDEELQRISNAQISFDKLMDEFSQKYIDLPPVEFTIKSGTYYDVLRNEIDCTNADLLVLEGSSKTGFLLYLDNKYRDLIDDVPCPVLVVPPKTEFGEIRAINYVTTCSPGDIKSLKRLTEFSGSLNAKVNVFFLSDVKSEDEIEEKEKTAEALRDKTEFDNLRVFLVKGDDVAETLVNASKEIEADILSVMHEEKGYFRRIFGSSESKKLTVKTDKPVLVFHEKDF